MVSFVFQKKRNIHRLIAQRDILDDVSRDDYYFANERVTRLTKMKRKATFRERGIFIPPLSLQNF